MKSYRSKPSRLLQSSLLGALLVVLTGITVTPMPAEAAWLRCNDGPYVPSDKIQSWAVGALAFIDWKAPYCGVKRAKFRINLRDPNTFVNMQNMGFLRCFAIHQKAHNAKPTGLASWFYYQYKASKHCKDNAWYFVTSDR